MKKILFVYAPVLALISQNAFAEEAKKEDKVFSFYGSVQAVGNLYSSENKGKLRDNLNFDMAELRPGVNGKWGKFSLDLQFELDSGFIAGENGTDWDRTGNPAITDIAAANNPSADHLYKAVWNQPIRKAFGQYKADSGTTLKVGLIRPQAADCVGFYGCGTTGFGNSVGASVGQDFDFGVLKGTATIAMVDKVDNVPAAPAGTTYDGKNFHYSVKGNAAEMIDFVVAYGNNYKAGADQSRFEASAIYNTDVYAVGAYMERLGDYTNVNNYASVTRVAVDAAYNVNENIRAVAGYSITTEGGKKETAASTPTNIVTEDVKYPTALNTITVGPRFVKDGAFAELALSYSMQNALSKGADGVEVKPFKNSKGEAGKETSATGAYASVGYEW